jgi:valyl-tRNA synthetase
MRIATKIFNASKFVMLQTTEPSGERTPCPVTGIVQPLDKAWICRMQALIGASERQFTEFDSAALLLDLESCFWDFCDNYLELVKARAYEGAPEAKSSARAALEWTMGAFLRLFAPFMPFITEEVWSWHYAGLTGVGSVHKAGWPSAGETPGFSSGDIQVYTAAKKVLEAIRTEKAARKKSVKCPVASVKIACSAADLSALEKAKEDILSAGNVDRAGFSAAPGAYPGNPEMIVHVELAPSA